MTDASGKEQAKHGAAREEPSPLSCLAVKFAWRIGLALLILFGIFGLVVALMVRAEINDQINASGARLVNTLAAIDMEYWKTARAQRYFNLFIGGSRRSDAPPDAGVFVQRDLMLKENPLRDAVTLSGVDTREIINVIITDQANLKPGDRVQVVMEYSVTGEGAKAKFDREKPYVTRDVTGQKVQTDIFVADDKFTWYKAEGGKEEYDVRQFRKPILDSGGKAVGNVILFVSARRIAEVTSRFVTGVVIACIVALLAAVGFSFLLAALVTRPVRRLVHDMNVVSRGDLTHRAFGYANDEVGMLAQSFNKMTRGLREAQKRELEQRAITRELEIAQAIQTSLLPSAIPEIPGFEIHPVYLPAKEIGGDYYDFIPIDDRHWGIMIADVSGKGIPGSMVMTMVRSLIRYEARDNKSPADTLRKTNRIITRDIKKGMFVTAFYVIVDLDRKSLKMSCAGHNPMLYWHARSGAVKTVKPSGVALGIISGPQYDDELQEVVINMEPNDRVVLYTDGVTEAMNKEREEFGMERLARVVADMAQRSAGEFSAAILDEVKQHVAGAEQNDDITMVNLRLLGPLGTGPYGDGKGVVR